MNKNRRKEIESIIEELESLGSRIEAVKEEEDDAFNNIPESLQYSEKGELMEQNVEDLDEAFNSLSDVVEELQEILTNN